MNRDKGLNGVARTETMVSIALQDAQSHGSKQCKSLNKSTRLIKQGLSGLKKQFRWSHYRIVYEDMTAIVLQTLS